ncbi:MAG: PilZ domain-containing protein [Syntrophobacteraceae bacterium]
MSFQTREHIRYKMKDGILAALPVPGTLKVIIGQIIDISEKGVALSHKDEITTSLNGAELVLMGHEQPDKPVFGVPARLVYEKELGETYRSGFQFGALSQSQTSRLASFLQSNIESIAV